MIVDDSEDSRVLLEDILHQAGYQDVISVDSAVQAFRHLGLAGSPRPDRPIDLVLLDVELPGLDGIRACGRIREDPFLFGVPVIMVTAVDRDEVLEDAFRVGAHDYVRKPVRRAELVARVRAALDRKLAADRAAEERADLEFQAGHDTVTGISRRRGLLRALDHEWRRACRAGRPIAFIMLDLDKFHDFNELYGHPAGDDCLRQVAATLATHLRRGGDQVSRLGGEEFGVLLPETDVAKAMATAELLRLSIAALQIPHSRTEAGVVTISAGVASLVPRQGQTPELLVKMADVALFEAKSGGRNRVRVAPTVSPHETLDHVAR